MRIEDLQEIWQSQHHASVDATSQLRILLKKQRAFRWTIFWRDVREVSVALLVSALFFYEGASGRGWAWIVLACLTAGVGLFMLADRWWHRARAASKGNSLAECATSARADVQHQIWLLRNVFWWYLLPLGIGLALVGIQTAHGLWQRGASLLLSVATCAVLLAVVTIVFVLIYWLNRHAVRTRLEPRLREIGTLLESLAESDANIPSE